MPRPPALWHRRSLFSTLTLLAALVLVGCDSSDPAEGPDTVTFTGTIGNAAALGSRPIANAQVTFTPTNGAAPAGAAQSSAVFTATTDAEGAYSIDLEPGSYTVTIERTGYAPTTRTVTVGSTTSLSETLTGSVTITGSLANSQDGQATDLGGARIVFLFEDTLTDDPIGTDADLETTAAPDGTFTFPNAPYGTFTCVVYATGFVPAVIRNVDVPEDGGEVDLNPAVVTERPPEGAYRIVLSWGQNPSDLDSHLTGPNGQGSRFHIYYVSTSFGDSNLDVDDTSSFGPETITLFPTVDGVYRYSVHNYSDRFNPTGALGIAGDLDNGQPARVEVYAGDRLLRSYRAPNATNTDGDTWQVFEMTVNGDNVSFSGNEPGGLGYVLVTDEDDAGQFITSPFPDKAGAR
ncbi:MAG: carboxypeptidase regulatory-like domain-containing protein [Bacteroidota bacterium]